MRIIETEAEHKIFDLLCIDAEEQLAMERNRARVHKDMLSFDATKTTMEDIRHE